MLAFAIIQHIEELMSKRGWKKRASSLKLQILEHENKIKNEISKPFPDEGCIHHWKAEMEAFQNSMKRVLKRLEK